VTCPPKSVPEFGRVLLRYFCGTRIDLMKKSFSEAQIIGILKEQESGLKVSDLCRKHGFHDSSFYKWQ
jgi:hypothetical protein